MEQSAYSLIAYAAGLMGFTLVKVLAPGYFARQDTATPVRVGLIALGSTMVLNVVLVVPWALAGWEAPHAGLAVSTSLGSFINSGLLYRGLRRTGVLQPGPGWGRFLLRVAVAAGVMAVLLLAFAPPTAAWLEAGFWTRCLWLTGGGRRRRCSPTWRRCWPSACGPRDLRMQNFRRATPYNPAFGVPGPMHVFRRPRPGVQAVPSGCVATIGVFDGVHLGHQRILDRVREEAARLGLPSLVFSFEPTPQEVMSPQQAPARLMRLREKVAGAGRGWHRLPVLSAVRAGHSRSWSRRSSSSGCWCARSASGTWWWATISASRGAAPGHFDHLAGGWPAARFRRRAGRQRDVGWPAGVEHGDSQGAGCR